MYSNRLLQRNGSGIIIAAFLLFAGCVQGCGLLEYQIYYSHQNMVLLNDHQSYREVGESDAPGQIIGTLDKLAGDTITTIGRYDGLFASSSSFVILVDSQEVYIPRMSVLGFDDYLYRQLGSRFSLSHEENTSAWWYAREYISHRSSIPLEVEGDNVIRTKNSNDSSAIHYSVTRSVVENRVVYNIVCRSSQPGFIAENEAHQMAFFMATGRVYVYEK
jgi:hypothetical protein